MDPLVVEAFALLGDQRKQLAALAGSQSLRSLSEAVGETTATLEVVEREQEAS